ncbi:thiamine-phosphate kinase [Sphaerotilus microaerophilus]|jgi:thiamine-monophosphate kinase|uniref:Thiamine-monophosphate kinase n=1 Tax=Sphaerotilus microaerophilus TaxID=2914710 RepID=A0ABM7YHQ4_9BURK|nr:thiamine-phosphate kinase [Sphaerotilus sp. FB-5]BDI03882.1 thiamine-monophosphate kinase [Sphaerotilus sp. FB-5]
MPLGEFELIDRFFRRPARRSPLGIGDDCALLAPAPGMQLAVSCDMLVEGRHFLSTVRPERLGHKALAVNLSDLAACGAKPLAYTLALSMPRVDEAFLAGFAAGLHALADAHEIELVGGDTTAGPLNLCITVFGEVPAGAALLRDGARPGDDLWVSHPAGEGVGGGIGDARLALEVFRGTVSLPGEDFEAVRRAMEQPQPRVALGMALRGVASAAIDVSDGLLGDLRHLLRRSGAAVARRESGTAGPGDCTLGVTLDTAALPRSVVLAARPEALQLTCLLTGGDDYELLFTAPPAARGLVERAAASATVGVRRIGRIEAAPGVHLLDAHGRPLAFEGQAFDHFRT